MPRYKVAHLREQGQDMIIIPLEASFGSKSDADQNGFMVDLQTRANAAGLRGTVAAVWPGGFRAPSPWHPFFRTLPIQVVMANLNREISW